MDFISWIQSNFILIAGLFTTIKWVWEYSQTRKFEKNKFLLERIEKFNKHSSTLKVQKLLDWNKTKIEINGEVIVVDDGFLVEGLKTHNQKMNFTQQEAYIREIFDDYFSGLTELIILSQTGLVDGKNLKRFFKYWVEILNGKKKNKPEVFSETIKSYLEFYGYSDVLNFLK